MANENENENRGRADQRARLELLENHGRRHLGSLGTGGSNALAAVCLCYELRELRAELASGNVEAAEVVHELRAAVEVAHAFAEENLTAHRFGGGS